MPLVHELKNLRFLFTFPKKYLHISSPQLIDTHEEVAFKQSQVTKKD